MNKKLLIFLALVAFVFSFAIYEAMKLDQKLSGNSFGTTGTIIKQIPDNIKFNRMDDSNPFDVQALAAEGNYIVVHFWGTYCGPCKVEFPELAELTQLLKKKSNIKFLFVAIDDDLVKAKKFLAEYNFAKENTIYLTDNNKEYRRFGTYKLPETFLFKSDSKIVKKYTGGQPWTQKYLVDYFKSL